MHVVGFMGWYEDPALQALFWVVVPIQGVVLALAIRGAARDGAGYAGRFLRGLGTSAVSSVLVFGNSLLFTQVVHPDYFEALRARHEELLREEGRPEAEVEAALEAAAAMYDPLLNALFGVIGTVVTGLVLSLLLAAVFKAREAKG